VSAELARHTEARRDIDCAAEDLDRIDRLGGRLITPDLPAWPTLAFTAFNGVDLRRHPDGIAPVALWALGDAEMEDVALRAAAVVGTRAATVYGEHVAADLSAGLCERGIAVVSGGAYGIDGAAHRAALAVDGCTVAVLAGGVDVPYPSGHSALLHRIQRAGLVVSEYPPGIRPARHRFLVRNRLVAALSRATVVVEAGLRSGAANTAAWARALGRVVCAVPGPVTSSVSTGCHVLLRDGAELVTRSEEVVEIVGRAGELADEQEHPSSALDDLTDVGKRVYEALPARGVRSANELAIESGLPVVQLQGQLALLELAGLAVRDDGRWRLKRPAKSHP
jgi:DNA processing protein